MKHDFKVTYAISVHLDFKKGSRVIKTFKSISNKIIFFALAIYTLRSDI